jgi:hypothetical protein
MRAFLLRIGLVVCVAGTAGGCAGRAAPASDRQHTGADAVADTAAATHAARENRLEAPARLVFDWSLQEREGRFSGQGVTRVAPPDRARLDLFGPRGEGYLSAVFIGGEIRLPAGSTSAPLPPPALLWSALGVFDPPDGATLTRSVREGRTLHLEYAAGGQRWKYRFEDDTLRFVAWTAPGNSRRTVELEGTGQLGLPRQAVYRDWPAFIELRMTLKEASNVDGFTPDTWSVGAP